MRKKFVFSSSAGIIASYMVGILPAFGETGIPMATPLLIITFIYCSLLCMSISFFKLSSLLFLILLRLALNPQHVTMYSIYLKLLATQLHKNKQNTTLPVAIQKAVIYSYDFCGCIFKYYYNIYVKF